jgi:hypothetical protein
MDARLYIFARDERGNVSKLLESSDRALLETVVDVANTPLIPQSPAERRVSENAKQRALSLIRA